LIPTKKAQPIQKFTSFFKSIIVELDRDPDMFPEGNITEVRIFNYELYFTWNIDKPYNIVA
jgi:hypothetical protein